MRYKRSAALVVACLALAPLGVVAAGCGGGGGRHSSGQTTPSTATSVGQAASTGCGQDAGQLGTVLTHLEAAATSDGQDDFAYGPDRTFLDGYADRAPTRIATDIGRLRDYLDRFAAAAQAAGVASGTVPTAAQHGAITRALNLSSSDLVDLKTSIQVLATWRAGGCSSGGGSLTPTGGQNVSAQDCGALGGVLADIKVDTHPDWLFAYDIFPADYAHDRDVVDGFASRAPSGDNGVQVLKLRAFLDSYASAAQTAGLASGTLPATVKEAGAIWVQVSLTGDERLALPTTITDLQAWTGGGCATGTPTAPATTEPSPSGGSAVSSQADCAALGNLVVDLDEATAGVGFDYLRDRDFLDGYASRAPGPIADSVRRLRDVLDQYASAAQAVGLQPGKDPLPQQAEKILKASLLKVSSSDRAANTEALQTVNIWNINGCTG